VKKQLVYKIDDTGVMGMAGTHGAAAQCYRLGNFVFMTGQTAFTLDGQLVGVGDPARQALGPEATRSQREHLQNRRNPTLQ